MAGDDDYDYDLPGARVRPVHRNGTEQLNKIILALCATFGTLLLLTAGWFGTHMQNGLDELSREQQKTSDRLTAIEVTLRMRQNNER